MRILYSCLLYLLTPVVLLRLLWRSRRAPDYRRRWAERFGYAAVDTDGAVIWVHCVSVGETLAAVPLIRGLQQHHPQARLLVTTTTPTGSAQVRATLGAAVMHCYMPYDLPGSVRRFLDRVRPQLVVILETELWPNLFARCHARAIPLAIVNARLSPRSFRGYARVQALSTATLQQAAVIAAQSESDAERFRRLGAGTAQLRVCGNIKFDMEEPADLPDRARALRLSWNYGSMDRRLIWIAASTHAGEDEQVLEAFAQVREAVPDLLLVLVPRHPERFDAVAERLQDWCHRRGWNSRRHSRADDSDAATAAIVGDTLGELRLFYAAADIAFVGGSLVPVGGHNILEPALAGLPVICGPHMFNFTEAAELLAADEALIQVQDSGQLASAVERFSTDEPRRLATGARGQRVVRANRGALQRTLAVLDGLLAPEMVRKAE